jgi:hypothetical protein
MFDDQLEGEFPMSSLAELRTKKRALSSWLAAASKDRNLVLVAAFSAIGLLISLNAMLRIPDFATIISQLN